MVRIDEGATRAEAYVDITRGQSANHLFVTRTSDALDGERLPEAPPPPLDASVAERLKRSGPERAAVEFPPAARRPGAFEVDSGWAGRRGCPILHRPGFPPSALDGGARRGGDLPLRDSSGAGPW